MIMGIFPGAPAYGHEANQQRQPVSRQMPPIIY